ncbi:MAG: hypothetical protein HZB16_12660 [Armatimonadetes bacterium]|nr:hypothetical protein [Armatimonadota bacterium]
MRDRLLVLLALVALPALAECDCQGNYKSLAAERAALPRIYDLIMGLSTEHGPDYHRARTARLDALPRAQWSVEDYDRYASSQARLRADAKAVTTVDAKIAALGASPANTALRGRYLARCRRYGEAAAALAEAAKAEPGNAAWAWQALAATAGPALVVRAPSRYTVGILGIDLAQHLTADFRSQPPVTVAQTGRGADLEAQVWRRLGLPPTPFECLPSVFELNATDQPEPFYALAELLAAANFRRLAWHSYQRAWDLEHPLSDDLAAYQSQVALGLPDSERYDLSGSRHYRARRAAVDWTKALWAYERDLLRRDGDPDDATAMAPFYQEHPKP